MSQELKDLYILLLMSANYNITHITQHTLERFDVHFIYQPVPHIQAKLVGVMKVDMFPPVLKAQVRP